MSRYDSNTITTRYFKISNAIPAEGVMPRTARVPMNFKGMRQSDVPKGRNGKHKEIVTRILSDLDQIEQGVALKVPLAQLTDSKEKVRSALNRATRKSA